MWGYFIVLLIGNSWITNDSGLFWMYSLNICISSFVKCLNILPFKVFLDCLSLIKLSCRHFFCTLKISSLSSIWKVKVLVTQSCPTLCDPVDCMQPSRLLCPWVSPGKNTGVGSHSFLQEVFLTQGWEDSFSSFWTSCSCIFLVYCAS